MNRKISGFDWDDGNWPKCTKHSVSKAEIEELFAGTPAVYADPGHSIDEQRLRAIGQTREGRWMLVAFTYREIRGKTYIRPVSARYMHQREVEHYERQKRK